MVSLCQKWKVKRNRRVRRFEGNCVWFQKVWNTYNEERFKCFRISRESFNFFLNWIGCHLTHNTTDEEPVLPQERLGICLYRLNWSDYYHIGVTSFSLWCFPRFLKLLYSVSDSLSELLILGNCGGNCRVFSLVDTQLRPHSNFTYLL